MNPFIWLIVTIIDIYWWIVIAMVIMSWLLAFNVVNIHNPFVRQVSYVLARLTEPLLAPIRRFMPNLGGLDLSAGSYAIYTVPDPAAWEVVVNRSIRQWGLESEYTDEIRAREVGRFTVPVEVLESPVETLTIRPVPAATGDVDLVLEWQTTRIRLPLESLTRVEAP